MKMLKHVTASAAVILINRHRPGTSIGTAQYKSRGGSTQSAGSLDRAGGVVWRQGESGDRDPGHAAGTPGLPVSFRGGFL